MDKVIITGVSSFVGFHLALKFHNSAFEVIGTMNRPNSPISLERINRLKENSINIENLDITHPEAIQKLIQEQRPDYWVHHAGWATDYHSMNYDFLKGFRINIEPLEIIYKELSDHKCRGIIITGTNAEYSPEIIAASEEDLCYPVLPYGLSKLCETIRAKQLANKYGLKTRVARVFIPFGLMDAPEKLIPSVANALLNNRDIKLTPCKQARDFLYIDDLCEAYIKLINDIDRSKFFDVFNICYGQALILKDLLLKMAEKINTKSTHLKFGELPMRDGETMEIYGKNNKAKEILNWKPRAINDAIIDFINDIIKK